MERRTSPPRWLWAVWLIALVTVIGIRWVIDLGDLGLTNVLTYALVLLAMVAGLTWFVFRSGHTAKLRYGTVAALLLTVLALSYTVEIRGWYASMVPILGLRGGGVAPAGAAITGGALADIDLMTATPYDFTGFLGSRRDARIDNVRLAQDWTAAPPELLWKQPVGAGWSGYAVVNGYAATLEERAGQELVTLYDVESGALLWARPIGGAFDHPMGGTGPRSTPLIHDGVVYAMGVNGHLVALDGASGRIIWERDILRDYGISAEEEAAMVAYGRPTSPLVVGDSLIVGVGGSVDNRVSVVAYQKAHGEVLWEGGNRNVSMASPGHGVLAGVEQILMVNEDWVSGHDVATGAVLWEFSWPGNTATTSNISQAVAVPPDKVFVSNGYGVGSALFRIAPQGDGTYTAEEIWHDSRVLRTKLTNVAMKDGYAYGLSEGILECAEVATGKRMWKAGRYQFGQILMVGDVLLVLSEDGELSMVEATPESNNNVLGRFQAIDGHTWNTITLYGDIVLVRNGQEAAAYRLPLDLPLMFPAEFEDAPPTEQ